MLWRTCKNGKNLWRLKNIGLSKMERMAEPALTAVGSADLLNAVDGIERCIRQVQSSLPFSRESSQFVRFISWHCTAKSRSTIVWGTPTIFDNSLINVPCSNSLTSKVRHDLSCGSHRLDVSFDEASAMTGAPHPVKLMQRLVALEKLAQTLKIDWNRIQDQRSEILPEVILIENEYFTV